MIDTSKSLAELLCDTPEEREKFELLANKKLLVYDLKKRMKELKITPAKLAKLMDTSRNQVYRLLDPEQVGIAIKSINRASLALGMRFSMHVEPITSTAKPTKRRNVR